MNYIDVQKMRKQAFWGELGEGISNAFNYGANNAGKAVKAVGSSITNTSNTKPANAFDAAVEQQRRNRSALTGGDPRFEAAFDNAARQRAITAQANRKEDAARYDAFAAEQRAQAQSRAARVNATIARQQRELRSMTGEFALVEKEAPEKEDVPAQAGASGRPVIVRNGQEVFRGDRHKGVFVPPRFRTVLMSTLPNASTRFVCS